MSIRSSSGFSHLQPGAFHIALQIHKIQHIQPREWKKRTNKHGLRLVPSTRREKFVTFSCSVVCIWLSRACIQVKFLLSHQECWLILLHWLSWLLSPQVPTPRPAAAISNQHIPTNFCLLPSSVDCPGSLPSLAFFWSGRRSRVQALCVGFMPKRKKGSSDWHSPTLTETNIYVNILLLQLSKIHVNSSKKISKMYLNSLFKGNCFLGVGKNFFLKTFRSWILGIEFTRII